VVTKQLITIDQKQNPPKEEGRAFVEHGYDFNACNNVRDILYNTDVINSVVKLIAHT